MNRITAFRLAGVVAFTALTGLTLGGTASAGQTPATARPAAVASPMDAQPPGCDPHDYVVNHALYQEFWSYDHTDYQYPYETLWYRHWTMTYTGATSPVGWSECGRTIPGAG